MFWYQGDGTRLPQRMFFLLLHNGYLTNSFVKNGTSSSTCSLRHSFIILSSPTLFPARVPLGQFSLRLAEWRYFLPRVCHTRLWSLWPWSRFPWCCFTIVLCKILYLSFFLWGNSCSSFVFNSLVPEFSLKFQLILYLKSEYYRNQKR